MARVALLMLAVLLVGYATAQAVDYQEERQTECWTCHADDPDPPTPLQSFWNIIPPKPQALALQDVATYELTVQNGWYHDVRYLEPALDLRHAPSLAFFDDREPFPDSAEGVMTRPTPSIDPTSPGLLPTHNLQDPARGHVTVHVPEGATSLTLHMQATDARTAPEVEWRIHAGSDRPKDDADFEGLYARVGEGYTFSLEGPTAFQGLSFGNWTIEGLLHPTDRDGSPNPYGASMPFSVQAEARFEASEQTVALLSRNVDLEPFQSTLFAWDLRAVAAPAAGEYITITVNGTAYYNHKASSNAIDWINVTKSIEVPVQADGDALLLRPDVDLLIVVPQSGASVSLTAISEAVGYASAFLITASIATGGIFGKATRRRLNTLFGGAKRRVAFHNFLSYGLTAAALAHMILFLYVAFTGGPYSWTLGLLWGGLAILAMFGLGVTGAMQVPIIRKWDYRTWRWTHFWLAIAAIGFTVIHMLLDGANFSAFQEWVGWQNPLDLRSEAGTT